MTREATKKDLPKGAEFQCTICWRIFTSDSTCELHKPYRKPISDTCKEPSSIGLVMKERRGLRVWSQQSSERMPFWLEREFEAEESCIASDANTAEFGAP